MIKSNGFALVLVLWILSLLTIMAGSFALSMRRESAIVAGSSTNASAMAVAESGLAVAELMLMNPVQPQRWRADGSLYQIDSSDSTVRVQLFAEAGKIDINSADHALLQGLMASTPLEPEFQAKLVAAIIDWRDADDLVQLGGAEKDDYKNAGLSYQPSNKPFQSIEELQLVLGMNEQVFKQLENIITVYSGQPKVDMTVASKEVLQLLPGVDGSLIEQYCAARLQSAINEQPAPPFPVAANQGQNSPSAANNGMTLGQSNAFGNTPQTTINNETPEIGIITIIAEALLDDGSKAIVKALIKKSDNAGSTPFQILRWQQNSIDARSLFTVENDALLVRQYAEPEFNH